jgi:putative nucleotidyltransferase with HDIG domain
METARQAAAEALRLAKVREHFRQIIERRELPPLPIVVTKVLRMLDDPDLNMRYLCRVLSDDAALASRILAVARSAYYGQRILPTTLQAAVQVMGLRDLRNVIVSIVTHSLFKCSGLVAEALWSHSLAVALASRLLSPFLGHDPEQAFLTGLLHDVGQMILLRGDREGYSKLARDTHQNQWQIAVKEREVYGFDHAQLGATLLDSWNFDVEIRTAVQLHHGDQRVIDPKSLAALLVTADFLACKAGLGFSAAAPVPAPEIMRTFAFDNEEVLEHAAEEVLQAYNSESALLKSA